MELRRELTPPAVSDVRRAQVQERIELIESLLESGESAAGLIREFNEFTGRQYDESMFRRYWRSMDREDFVRQVSRPYPQPVPNVTREELVEIVRRAMPQSRDPDYECYMEIFDANVPLDKASNLICYPLDYDAETNTWGDGRPMGEYDPTPEDVVTQALSGRKRRESSWSAEQALLDIARFRQRFFPHAE